VVAILACRSIQRRSILDSDEWSHEPKLPLTRLITSTSVPGTRLCGLTTLVESVDSRSQSRASGIHTPRSIPLISVYSVLSRHDPTPTNRPSPPRTRTAVATLQTWSLNDRHSKLSAARVEYPFTDCGGDRFVTISFILELSQREDSYWISGQFFAKFWGSVNQGRMLVIF